MAWEELEEHRTRKKINPGDIPSLGRCLSGQNEIRWRASCAGA